MTWSLVQHLDAVGDRDVAGGDDRSGPWPRPRRASAPRPPCLSATPLRFSTTSVTSSRTPDTMELNSCRTLSIWTLVMAAPCSDDISTRRSALPSVSPKPRSSGSAVTVACRWRVVARLDHVELRRLDQFLPVLVKHVLSPQFLFGRSGLDDAEHPRLKTTAGRAAARSPRPVRSRGRARQTRRRLGGRHAVMGHRRHVADRGDVATRRRPAPAARSRGPPPGPCTSTSSVLHAVLLRLACRHPRRPSGRRRASTCATP